MTQYLTEFENEQQYNDFKNSNDCPYINVSYVAETDEVKYFKDEIDTYQAQPFTLHIDRLSNGAQIELTFFVQRDFTQSGVVSYCRYKINNDPWKTQEFIINDDPLIVISGAYVQEGDTVQLICKTNQFNTLFAYRDTYDLQCTVSGNVMSLLYGDDYVFASAQTLPWPQIPYDGVGEKIEHIGFNNYIVPNTVDASNLWLPIRNLCPNIFEKMFYQQYDLTAAPDIKAKHLPENACKSMFEGCTSLTTMPNVLAEKADIWALDRMFTGCSALVNTTQLHVKEMSGPCMNFMFAECTSLATAPVWDEDVIFNYDVHSYYWDNMVYIFDQCSSLVDASPFYIRANDIDIFNAGFHGVTRACTSLQRTIKFGTCSDPVPSGDFSLSDYIPDTQLVQGAELYLLMTTGGISVSSEDPAWWENGGTVYVLHGSRYLPDGDLYGLLPGNLPNNWTVAEYVPASA